MTALALLVRVVAGALAGVLVTLVAHFGLHLDQDTAVTVVAAGVTALGAVVLHWASDRWPVLGRAVAWLAREAAELRPLTGTTAATGLLPPYIPGQQFVPRPTGGGNVTVVAPATTGTQVIQTGGMPDGYVPPSASLTPPQDGPSTGSVTVDVPKQPPSGTGNVKSTP